MLIFIYINIYLPCSADTNRRWIGHSVASLQIVHLKRTYGKCGNITAFVDYIHSNTGKCKSKKMLNVCDAGIFYMFEYRMIISAQS